MKRRTAALSIAVALLAPLAHAQEAHSIRDATVAAERWLADADKGDGAATWDRAALQFQSVISRSAWHAALKSARDPLGAMKSRQIASAVVTRSLPGVPDGE